MSTDTKYNRATRPLRLTTPLCIKPCAQPCMEVDLTCRKCELKCERIARLVFNFTRNNFQAYKVSLVYDVTLLQDGGGNFGSQNGVTITPMYPSSANANIFVTRHRFTGSHS